MSPGVRLVGDAAFESWWVDETFRLPTDDDVRWAREVVTGEVAA